MRLIGADELRHLLDWPGLVQALYLAFETGCETPVRHHHTIAVPGEPDATLLLMPAWTPGHYLGVKILNVFPGNAARAQPALSGQYLLMSAHDGTMLALIDGDELTVRRTAAASALAARYLARADAEHLLLVSTGRLSDYLAAAHVSVRTLRRVSVWGRQPDKAAAVAARLAATGLPAQAVTDLAAAAAQADIISCATLATTPLICGEWLRPGTHVDLVGGFTPLMREADDVLIRRAEVYVDTRAGAMQEAGDIVQPLASGVLRPEDIRAELAELVRSAHPGRTTAEAITLFKSVGTALEDLCGAVLAYERSGTVA